MTVDTRIQRTLKSPPTQVYEVFAGSAKLAEVRGIQVEILEPGQPGGVGVLRRVTAGPMVMLEERVVALDPDRLIFEYRIEKSRPSFEHERGTITFRPSGSGSAVTWESTASIPLGRRARFVEPAARIGAGAAFSLALMHIDRHLTRTNSRGRSPSKSEPASLQD
jgi:uncharacterized protein YndB with AHSA1/START domain